MCKVWVIRNIGIVLETQAHINKKTVSLLSGLGILIHSFL